MHAILTEIRGELRKAIAQLSQTIPNDEPLGIAHGNWSFPGVTRAELVADVQSVVDLIDQRGLDSVATGEKQLKDYVRRIQFLQSSTIPNIWGNAGLGVPALLTTLDGLRKALVPALKADDAVETAAKLRRLTTQLRGMEARLNDLDPRTTSLATMVERIEKASEAADQLPADLESLTEARGKISKFLLDATKDQGEVSSIRERAEKLEGELNGAKAEAQEVLQRCESAYTASTSVGLAAAFAERSSALNKSMWLWVIGLISALVTGGYFGWQRLTALSALFEGTVLPVFAVVLNLLLSVVSVGAPIWFAWLATKQIGQRFRLAEDYGYKASIARAYEGFRRETTRVDKEMEVRLLSSALTRLDELPGRLVEAESHGSPWHELASSAAVKQAFKMVPDFADQVKSLAGRAIGAVAQGKATAAAAKKATDSAA